MAFQQIRRCPQCEKFRHITSFRGDFGPCLDCEQEGLFAEDNRDWVLDLIVQHEHDLRTHRQKTGVHENYALDSSMISRRKERIAAAVETLLSGNPPHGIGTAAWKITQDRLDGTPTQDIATRLGLPKARIEEIERETMRSLYRIAEQGMEAEA